jgi:DNA polymerase
MVVGQNPGREEDARGRAFIGDSGRLLDILLEEVGLHRGDLYVTNAVKGYTRDNREPTLKEIKGCRPFLLEEVQQVRPRIILALGNVALRGVCGKSGITNFRGKELYYSGDGGEGRIKVVATFHPAAALRYPRFKDKIREDFAFFRRTLEGTSTVIDVRYHLL